MIDIGTRVRLSVMGKERWKNRPSNPHNRVGVVIRSTPFYPDDMPYLVGWSNGRTSYYDAFDLEPVEPIKLEDLI